MASRTRSNGPQPGGVEPAAAMVGAAMVVAVPAAVLVWLAVQLGGGDATGGPIGTLVGLASRERAWPGASATAALIVELLLLLGVVVLAGLAWRRWRDGSSAVDGAARRMGRGRQLAELAPRAAKAKAERLIGPLATGDPATHGVLLGRTVAGRGVPLRASWEDTIVVVAGPRRMKTSTQIIPAAMDAPGPVVVTSNKRDVVDALRDPRAAIGQVWVFDPQQRVDQAQDWWWNPLDQITSVTAAQRLAAHFASATYDADARKDAFWDTAGERTLALLFLAAALSKQTMREVFGWVNNPLDPAPVYALREHHHPDAAEALKAYQDAPEKQRDGVFGSAQTLAGCLMEPTIIRWVLPGPERQFRPAEFVRSRDTLFPISREGVGTAAPLTTALVAEVLETAETVASASSGGRLPRPMLAALDEAANICRIRDLPDLYSHLGSRGIVLQTMVQNRQQAAKAWGDKGWETMWSAANIRIYGGGVPDQNWLDQLTKLIGEWDAPQTSVSWSEGRRTVQHSVRRDLVLDTAQLAQLPRGRAVLWASGMPATLIEPISWTDGPHRAAIEASRTRHDPEYRPPEGDAA